MSLSKLPATARHQGVVSLRHSHNFRFGQDDVFVSVKVKVPSNPVSEGSSKEIVMDLLYYVVLTF